MSKFRGESPEGTHEEEAKELGEKIQERVEELVRRASEDNPNDPHHDDTRRRTIERLKRILQEAEIGVGGALDD